MALAADEERALSRIEDDLRRSDPKLAAKLAMFNRLTQSEAMPQRELLTAPSRLRRLFDGAGARAAPPRPSPPGPPTRAPAPAPRAAPSPRRSRPAPWVSTRLPDPPPGPAGAPRHRDPVTCS